MRVAIVSLLLVSSPALAQEQRVQVSADMRADIAHHIRAQGFDCPEVKEVVYVGRDGRGGNVRVTCTAASGPPGPVRTFRVIGNVTAGRVTPWQP